MNLPLIKTFEDAAGLAADHQDDFYIYLFLIRAWIGELFLQAVATYSVNKDPRKRSMQTEQAWARLSRVFRRQPEKYLPFFFDSIARYSKEFDDEFSMFTRQAISSLTLHESLQDQPLTIRHLCSWLDSIIHLHIHELSHTGPVCFDPDPDKRDLALLGVAQRHLAESSRLGNEAWSADFSHSIRRFQNSSKWRKLGQAMASAQQHP